MKSCFLLTAACLLSAGALHATDSTAPVVTSIAITPTSVEVGSGPVNVTVSIGIDDPEVSGETRGGVYGGYITLVSPTTSHVKNVSFHTSELLPGGTNLSGTYRMTVEIPGYGTPGPWEFAVYVFDNDNNNQTYGTGDGEVAFPVPADATFTVTNANTPDTTGPVATNIVFSPLGGDVSAGPLLITGTFDLADTPSGVDYGYLYVEDPNGDTRFSSFGSIDVAHRLSGTEYNGSYQTVASIPQNAMNGTWKVFLGVRDKLGKYTFTPRVPIEINGSSAAGSLADACDATQFPWTSHGDGVWAFQTGTTYDGLDAARSGPIGDNGQSIMEVEVSGPGTLSFWWKTDCANGDFLSVETTGSGDSDTISGQTGWTQVSLDIEEGEQTVTWIYAKDSSGSAYQDCGFVDRVTFLADEDSDSPRIQYLNISPNPASVANGDVDVTLTFEISDDSSGFSYGHANIFDPNGNQISESFSDSDVLPGGDNLFGTYQVTFTINQTDLDPDNGYLSLGDWHAEIEVNDNESNSATYGGFGNDAVPVPSTDEFVVTDAPPGGTYGIASIDPFVPNPVDVTGGSQTLAVNFTVGDPDGILDYGNIVLYRPDNTFVDSYYFNEYNGTDGHYSITVNVPRYGQPGEWRVAFLLIDKDGQETDVDGPIRNPGDNRFTGV